MMGACFHIEGVVCDNCMPKWIPVGVTVQPIVHTTDETRESLEREVARLKQENAALQQKIAEDKIGPRCGECDKAMGGVLCLECADDTRDADDGNPYGGLNVPADRDSDWPCEHETIDRLDDGIDEWRCGRCKMPFKPEASVASQCLEHVEEAQAEERKATEEEIAAWVFPQFGNGDAIAGGIRRGEYRNQEHVPADLVNTVLGIMYRDGNNRSAEERAKVAIREVMKAVKP